MKIPLELVTVDPSHEAAVGRYKQAILLVEGGNFAGYTLGFVPEGHAARQVCQGTLVPGPWAYAFANCTVMDTQGGTGAELARAEGEGRIFRTRFGEEIEVGEKRFVVERTHNQQIKLRLVA